MFPFEALVPKHIDNDQNQRKVKTMPKWDVQSYEGEYPPLVVESPLERERKRVFWRKVGDEEQVFVSDLRQAILEFVKLEEEKGGLEAIVEKFLGDYRHYKTGFEQGINGVVVAVLERVEDGFDIVDI